MAALNVLTYFATVDHGPHVCGPAGNRDCRGADSAFELERQRAKILAALDGRDAAVIGLIELANDAGASHQQLGDGLNARVGAGTDAVIGVGDAVDVRAERDETGDGRVYHVTFSASDSNGQVCVGTVTVEVPRSQGKNGAAVDDGPPFDATLV